MSGTLPHVVILGGGFGGLSAARALAKAPVRVTLVDRRNHHLFQPLLYQVATAALSAPDIAVPIRRVLRRQANATVYLAEVERVDVAERRVILDDRLDHGSLSYDYLVVATGASHTYFGHDEWEAWAPGLKTVDDALEIRRRILLAFEAAEREPDPARRAEWLTFVVVGAGPTGVELAGALAEISQRTLARDFRNFDPRTARVVLVEGMDRVFPAFPPDVSEKALEHLRELGVEVRTKAMVTRVDAGGVEIGDERLASRTVVWAAGVEASHLGASLGAPTDRAGRVVVEPDLSVPGHPEVFVIGDLASVAQPDGENVPGVAQGAIQAGKHVARNLQRTLRGEAREPFVYKDKGYLATIGRSKAVGLVGRTQRRVSGLVAWLLWAVIHVTFLIGFRNRLMVLLEWAWAYATWQRGARVIVEERDHHASGSAHDDARARAARLPVPPPEHLELRPEDAEPRVRAQSQPPPRE